MLHETTILSAVHGAEEADAGFTFIHEKNRKITKYKQHPSICNTW